MSSQMSQTLPSAFLTTPAQPLVSTVCAAPVPAAESLGSGLPSSPAHFVLEALPMALLENLTQSL